MKPKARRPLIVQPPPSGDVEIKAPAQGIAAPKISGMYNPGTDIRFVGSDTPIEVKRRATGCAQLYDWLNDRDVLIGKADRREQVSPDCNGGGHAVPRQRDLGVPQAGQDGAGTSR
jgi:hypothetical protein